MKWRLCTPRQVMISFFVRIMEFKATLENIRSQGGILILAHPLFFGHTPEEALRHNLHGIEVYNHLCHWLNGRSESFYLWDLMLKENAGILGVSADDSHFLPKHPVWNGGWIMVNAPGCTPKAIMRSIKSGNYYSTCGPDFYSMETVGRRVSVTTSPVRFIRCIGPELESFREGRFDGQLLSGVSFTIPAGWDYVRLEIEDEQGKRAWTNTLLRK